MPCGMVLARHYSMAPFRVPLNWRMGATKTKTKTVKRCLRWSNGLSNRYHPVFAFRIPRRNTRISIRCNMTRTCTRGFTSSNTTRICTRGFTNSNMTRICTRCSMLFTNSNTTRTHNMIMGIGCIKRSPKKQETAGSKMPAVSCYVITLRILP